MKKRNLSKSLIRWFSVSALCVSALCAARPAAAQSSNAGTGAGAFMKIPFGSARAMGMGQAYTALAEGVDGMAWNPAALAYTQQREVEVSHLNWLQDYGGNYIAYAQPLGQSVVGVNMAYSSIDGFDARDANAIAQPSDDVTASNMFASVALARSFFTERLALGGAVKRVSENNAGDNYASVVFDLGARLRLFNSLYLGASAQNIGNKQEVVQITRYGAALEMSQYLTVTGEVQKPSDNKNRLGLGAEITLPEDVLQVGKFMFRVGYFSNDDAGTDYDTSGLLKSLKLNESSNLTLGAGLYSGNLLGYAMGLDFAMAPYGALGRAEQISVRVSF